MTAENGTILVVDDTPATARLMSDLLTAQGYSVRIAVDGIEALAELYRDAPDLVLLDLLLPGLNGIEICGRIKGDSRFAMLPIVMITSSEERSWRLHALREGADDFIRKPVDRDELLARVRSLLRIKRLFDTVERQASELADWSALLEKRVHEEFDKVQRLSRLKRFFSTRLADVLVAQGDAALESHRREIVVVVLDLHGYTAFAESAQPEEVMQALAEFHSAMGRLIEKYEATLERFTGDGMLLFFNDPVPTPDASTQALCMALEMSRAAKELGARWRDRGFDLGLGIGVARGFATLGKIGFEGRIDYGAIGAVTNLAQRICAQAQAGEVLAARRVLVDLDSRFEYKSQGALTLRGFARPVEVVQVFREIAA